MNRKKVLVAVGTRPEAIKMAPVILKLKKEPWADVVVLATAQHRQMLDQVLKIFEIVPDNDLNIMRQGQSLTELSARLLLESGNILKSIMPDLTLVQGDTTTAMIMALACFYNNISVGHVEAGLRTRDMQNPFPEELNRVFISKLSKWHFAPTESSRQNLLDEGISDTNIVVTGNTVIDALHIIKNKDCELGIDLDPAKRVILVTFHRRENFGKPIKNLCEAIRLLADKNKDIQFLFPVHLNPSVRSIVYPQLEGYEHIILCDPLEYPKFVMAMKKAYFIISDSGGVQEEATALFKPILVTREKTERQEAIDQGFAKLVGTNSNTIIREAQRLLDDNLTYQSMVQGASPYGDGHGAGDISQTLRNYFNEMKN